MSTYLLAALLLFQSQAGGRQTGGYDGPPLTGTHEPTAFERFADKLSLDDTRQLPDVAKILSAAAAQGAAIGREMISARLRLIELDGKPEATAVLDAFTAASAKLTALDARTYQQVYAILDKGQQSKSADAFLLTAGLLDVALPRAGRGGRGAGGNDIRPTRMELLTAVFTLDGAQKKQVKSIMDAESKASSAARDQWTASRMAIGKAIQSGAAADIEQAVSKHAADAAQMAAAEARAMAKIVALLTPEQKANASALQRAVFDMRLAFASKKWDVSPE